MAQEPMIKLEPGGVAPILSYNVPEPTSYAGRHVVELRFADDVFSDAARVAPPPPASAPTTQPPIVVLPTPPLRGLEGVAVQPTTTMARTVTAETSLVRIKNADAIDVSAKAAAGFRVARYMDMNGQPAGKLLPPVPPQPRPRLLRVEVYRLSSYLGTYGAGRVLKTFSLLPGASFQVHSARVSALSIDPRNVAWLADLVRQQSGQ